MNSRGQVIELLAPILFAVIIAFGMVFPILLVAINSATDEMAYQTDFHSKNLALLLESVQSVPRDLDLVLYYYIPALGLEVSPHAVTVAGEAPRSFPFDMDPDIELERYAHSASDFVSVSRHGDVLSFVPGRSRLKDGVFCPDVSIGSIQFTSSVLGERLARAGFGTLGPPFSADAIIGFKAVDRGVLVFVNEDSAGIGCLFMKNYLDFAPFSSINLVPVDPQYLPAGDPLRLLEDPGAIVIGLSPDTDSRLVERAVGGML